MVYPLLNRRAVYTLMKAEILNQQFFSVFNKDDNSTFPDLRLGPHPTMPDIEFSTTGIQKILTNLNIKKAQGPDGITARYLTKLAPIVAPCLQRIFSKCWRQANICPI